MLPITPRQQEIIRLARETGRVNVEGLAQHFSVTPQTIRKDLNDLADQGLLQRYHGGAIIASGVANFGYEARRMLATEEKRRIGIKAASLIPDNSSILINIGTTTESPTSEEGAGAKPNVAASGVAAISAMTGS